MDCIDKMRVLLVFLSLLSISIGSPINGDSPDNQNDNGTPVELTSPQPEEKDGNVSRWLVLLAPRIIENDSTQIDTNAEESLRDNETENKPYTIFEPNMDPSKPENYIDLEDLNPLKTILSSLFNFQPSWPWNTNDDNETDLYAPTEPTPSLKVSKNLDAFPEIHVLATPPTVETENPTEFVSENEIESSLMSDLKTVEDAEKLAMKLEEKERVEFILDDDTDLEFYKQQLDLLKSMESTLAKLKSYFDHENEKQQKLLDQSWNNSIIIASVGIIYLLLIFAFFSFKSLFEAEKAPKEEALLEPTFSIEKSPVKHV